jgi:hypothetical protein
MLMGCPNCGVYCGCSSIFCNPPIDLEPALSELIVSTQKLADALTEEEKSSYNPGPDKSPMPPDPWLDTREFAPTHMDF